MERRGGRFGADQRFSILPSEVVELFAEIAERRVDLMEVAVEVAQLQVLLQLHLAVHPRSFPRQTLGFERVHQAFCNQQVVTFLNQNMTLSDMM